MAPPYRRSFSVSVVFPASGCEMIAKVRRRAASAAMWLSVGASRVSRIVSSGGIQKSNGGGGGLGGGGQGQKATAGPRGPRNPPPANPRPAYRVSSIPV